MTKSRLTNVSKRPYEGNALSSLPRPPQNPLQSGKIVVEVKSFRGPSWFQDFKLAVGQYDIYREFMQATTPERELYLAISHRVYHGFFRQEAIKFIVEKRQLALITVDTEAEEIVTWIK